MSDSSFLDLKNSLHSSATPQKINVTRYEGYAGDSLVVIDLFPDGDTTRLKLTHTGLETFPPVADLEKENFNRGWNNLMDALQKVVE